MAEEDPEDDDIDFEAAESEAEGEDDEVVELPEASAHDISEPPKPHALAAPWSNI